MPSGAIAKLMANKQIQMIDEKDNVMGSMTYSVKMTNIDYARYDSLVPKEKPIKDVQYIVNLSHAEEIEYRVNFLKQHRIIGGKHLTLADGGKNGTIIGLDMKILYFNNDGKRVSIRIAGDHQLKGNKLCCGCSVAKSSVG